MGPLAAGASLHICMASMQYCIQMDASGLPLSWENVRIFLAVAHAGSIAAAAKELRIDAATVSRRLASLERQLGASLVTRGRAGARLTDEGESVRALAESAAGAMLAIAQSRAERDLGPAGTVRLATSGILGAFLLAKHVPNFLREYPDIRLEIVVARRLVDLSNQEADVALRLRPTGHFIAEPATHALKLATVGFALFGTRRVARSPQPRFIRLLGYEPATRAIEARTAGRPATISVDELPTALALARSGCGLAILPCYMGDGIPGLVRASEVLERHLLYAAFLSELRKAPRVDAVIQWLKVVVRREQRRLDGRE